MGTGEFVCISMTGGAPWGFRLHGGKEQNHPLQVAKIRGKSKASRSGLQEGDEVVSINGTPCADLTYSEVIKLMESITDSLQILIKRPSSGINETYIPETENKDHDHLVHEDHVESTSLHIWPHCTQAQRASPGQKDESNPDFSGETKPSSQIVSHPLRRPWAEPIALGETEEGRLGAVVELQLSLSPDRHKDPGALVGTVPGGAENHPSPDPYPNQLQGGLGHGTSAFSDEKEDSGQRPRDKLLQLSSGRELQGTQGREAGAPHLSRAEVIISYSYDREKAEGSNWAGRKGCGDFQVEGGRAEAPPSVVSFPISSEGIEQGEDQQISERDHRRPHKHRARHARFRRSESLSEKQVKEAKSKCKSIALLLTNALNPNSKGVLMFKKRRRRAKKYTLVSYGTGELQREADTEEESEKDGVVEVKFTSESEVDEEIVSDADDEEAPVWTPAWNSGLVDAEKKLKSGDKMQMLPDSSGKGVLMFAKRRERMDQITAQQEEVKAEGVARREFEDGQADGLRTVTSYQTREEESVRMQSNLCKSYLEGGHIAQQNGFSGAPELPEAHRLTASNRTAKPFPGSVNQTAVPFSPTRNLASPLYDFPAPPPYSAVTPPPEILSRGATSPLAAPAQPPPWPQPAPWAQQAFYEPTEQIASRDERIAVPAKRTGILQEARRRGTSKPMFTFKETPKVSPNPELLSLVQNAEGKKGTGAGFESGPEEDYLSLGAEACNFMQGHSSKQKTPPPVAPKPSAKPSPSQPVTPISPVWSPSTAAPSQPPAFPVSNQAQGINASAIKIARPASTTYQPPSTPNVAGPFKGPQAAVASVNYAPKATPAGNATPVSGTGPSSELPQMSGKGAQLFAKRQSRMEKYVVDSEKVQAHMARAQSPTPSLPASWKYSSNVRAPPPVAYNPIHSPAYPPAAIKQQSGASAASKPTKKKGKKPLNALDVMKHQPYQLNASLFTFQPPDAKDGPVPKPLAKHSPVPVLKPASPSSQPVNASSPTTFRASSVCSVPAYSSQPTFHSEAAATPVSPSPVPIGLPTSPKPDSAPATYFVAPRPKFSAKKSGVTVQDGGQSLPHFGRPVATTTSPSSLMFQPSYINPSKPAGEPAKVNKRLTPWEAAAKSPFGLVDDAFGPRNIQESIMANVVSAAHRKSFPEPFEDWKPRISYAPQAQKTNLGPLYRRENGIIPNLPKNTRAISYANSQYDAPLPYFTYYGKPSRTGFERMTMETKSEYGLSFSDGNYNPHPRGWKRET
ncbi:synaptopodin-2 isoform X1 [Antechinus flavipes]|uniref:synaptopodin-2 isoform X1 n=2 Tax=Antechinus flavipes TaxID=38775 RepID=UPI0022369AD2|nr:synaptopodin-2 isoform X1 [Antechinus flavipes]